MNFRISVMRIAFLLLAAPCISYAQIDSLTLDQAIKATIDNHPAIMQAMQGIVQSEGRIEQSRSAYYPDISALASYERIGPVPEFIVPGAPSEPLAPASNYDLHIGLRQTVFDFGKRNTSVDLARSDKNRATTNVEFIKANLAYQAAQVFYSILFLDQNINVLDDQIDALNQHLDITQKKVQGGTATKFDVLTTQVRVATTQSQRIDAVEALHRQEAMFRQLTGMPPESPIILKGEFAPMEISLNSDSLIALAMDQRPEAKLSHSAEETARIQQRLASLGDMPSLSINMQGGFKNGYFPDLNKLHGNWAAGASIQAPIFNGFQKRSQVRQANAGFQGAQEHSRDVKNQVIADVIQAISNVQASEDKIRTTETPVDLAVEAVKIAQGRYNAGVATNLDLLDAETALANARLIYFRALYELVISQYSLDKAIGNKIW